VHQIDAVLAGIGTGEWRRFLEADRTRWAILSGERLEHGISNGYDAAAAEGGGVIQPATGDEVARLNVMMTDALVAVMSGRLAAADRHIEAGLPLADRLRAEVPNGADLLRLTRWVLLLFAGRLEQSRALAIAALDGAGAGSESAGTWEYAVALVDLHAGQPAAAAGRSAAAIPLLEWRDFTGLVDTTRAVHATALAQLGRAAEARAAIERLGPASELDVWAALQHAQAEAWLAVAERRRPDLAAVAAAGRRGVAAGQLCLSAFTSHTAVRLGAPELVVDDLHDAALRAEGAVLPTFAAHAAAAAARRPTDLLDAAAQLAELGLHGAAADAARQAAALFAAAGRPDAARHAHRRAATWAGAAGPAHDLTARELVIATRAAERWSSRAIAEQLGVSVRTVDNHLGRVYRKLGIAGRPELGEALRAVGATG
jgi:DNA-binding CsgD family transcriptional regulator